MQPEAPAIAGRWVGHAEGFQEAGGVRIDWRRKAHALAVTFGVGPGRLEQLHAADVDPDRMGQGDAQRVRLGERRQKARLMFGRSPCRQLGVDREMLWATRQHRPLVELAGREIAQAGINSDLNQTHFTIYFGIPESFGGYTDCLR